MGGSGPIPVNSWSGAELAVAEDSQETETKVCIIKPHFLLDVRVMDIG